MIRPADVGDITRLQEIEVAAGEMFRPLGMDLVADDDPITVDELRAYVEAGHVWVAWADDRADAVGYLVLDVVDGAAHVEQVTVHPQAARRGVGRALVEHVASWAAAEGFAVMTLTTFVDVPWNAPYYERLGFRQLGPADEGQQLRRVRSEERAHGLDAWPRVSMGRDLTA
ncbi:MAG: GNAT family N-acetyltransferase [Sporichthyaceae bacterium]